jgi:hypothetical protein
MLMSSTLYSVSSLSRLVYDGLRNITRHATTAILMEIKKKLGLEY